ncbi:DUF1592 domain-containing protein [Nannocystaceae bacterium ST9]
MVTRRPVELLSLGLFALLAACQGDGRGSTFGGTFDEAGEGDGDGDDEGLDDGEYAAPRLRILLARQYVATIGDLLGPQAAQVASTRADVTLNGFDAIGAAQLALTSQDIDVYEKSAGDVAAAAVATPGAIDPYLSCTPIEPGDAECMRSFVDAFGSLAWRRPLDESERTRWADVGLAAALDFGDFDKGVEFVIAGMLQSPNFIYQVEIGEPDPDNPGLRRLSGAEVATRMSYFLLDTTPSRELLEAAAAGELDTAEGVRAWAESMVLDPRARFAFDNFFEEVLYLRKLDETAKDLGTYPSWSPYLADSMRVETLALVDDVIWLEDGDYRDVLTADYTFVNEALAEHYGIAHPGGTGFQKVALPPGEKRGGIFGHASLLSVLAHVSSTSPTLRGKFIQERMMCTSIPPPPPGVVTDLPSGAEYKTMRERLAAHQEQETCAICHTIMDPPGLGLENYDGVGQFRTMENGVVIDTKSDLDGDPFDGAAELGAVLRERPKFSLCTVLNLYRHATGHVELSGELERLVGVDESFIAAQYRFKSALVELVASKAFRFVGEQDQ